MSTPARIDGDVIRVNWRLAEVLHQYRGLKNWKSLMPKGKHTWYIKAVRFRAAMIGRGLEVTPRYDTDTHERFEPDKLKYGSKGQIQCVHCSKWVEVSELFRTDPQSKILDRCIYCADCLHLVKEKFSDEGLVRCRDCGIIVKVLKYKGRWA